MDDMVGAVADAPEVEVAEVETPEIETEGTETPEQPEVPETGNKLSREYSQWLKGGMNPQDPNAQKFGRMAKDDHARMFALSQLDPKGIDGVRERYALLDAIQHGDLKGPEAIQAIQDTLNEVAALDEQIVQGNVEALQSLGPEMQAGVMKMIPHLLEMQKQSDAEAYKNAVLPHFVEALRASPMVASFNALVDVLNEQPPSWLPPDRKEAWTADRLNRVIQHAGGISEWLNAQDKQAKALQTPNVPRGTQPNAPNVQDERGKLDMERQQLHYQQNITPQTNKYAETRFSELLKPYDTRLKLSETAKNRLAQDFVSAVTKKAQANPVYKSQMDRFWKSRNVDPKQVTNLFKVEFDKHAKAVMDGLVQERYGNFLKGKGNQTATARPAANGNAKGPVGPQEYVVSSRPSSDQIDHQHPQYMDLYAKHKYPMKDGRIAVWRKQ